jgi:ADP-L-glycero-D-manno-heptose 6-epimerase
MILLTGGAGFIGSCLLKKFNDNGIDDIVIVDHLGKGCKWKNLVGKKYFNFFGKDDFYANLLENGLDDDIDTVIHLGACTDTTETDADYLMDNNLNLSILLSTFALSKEAHFIYASSAATYGAGENGYSDTVFDNLRPLNPYGYSKHQFDLFVKEAEFDKKFVGLKFFNVFGPNEYHKGEMSSMIYKAYNQIKETGKVQLFKSYKEDYKDGEQKRDFIYVKDVVDMIWKFYQDPKSKGIYNIGTGNATTWNELMTAVFKAMNLEPNIEYIDMPQSIRNQYQYFTEADMKRMKRTKYYSKTTPIEEAVADYVQNYLMQDWQHL